MGRGPGVLPITYATDNARIIHAHECGLEITPEPGLLGSTQYDTMLGIYHFIVTYYIIWATRCHGITHVDTSHNNIIIIDRRRMHYNTVY